MLNFLKRDQAKDPFGGDDMYEPESRFAGKGPKIALAASVVLFLLLAGGIAAIIMTGKTTPPPVTGSFADIEVVDEPAPAATAAATPEAAPAAVPGAPAAKTDTTAATDRSTERRPWLAAPATSTEKRPGVNEPAAKAPETKTAAKAPETKAPEAKAPAAKAPEAPAAKAPDAKTALMTPPPAPAAAPVAAPAKAPEVKAPEVKTAATPAPAPAKTAEIPKDPAPQGPAKDPAVADASPFGPAPGAPSLFNAPAGADAGPAVAGGRPRLVDPANPPIDKTAIAAPPPRFANIVTPKKDAAPAKGAVPTTAKVAVVIDGLGLSQSATDAAIAKLPAAVTLAFSPYTRNLKKWTEKAKAGGHEVLIQVPMESKEFPAEDPGPLGLLTSIEAKENAQRLDAVLKDAGDAVGVLDAEGSKFRESEAHISAVFTKLKEKNLFYVQGEPGVRVGEASVPVAVADVVLDERPFRAAVDARLDYAERLAKYQGSAVATVGAKPVSFERLVLWLEQAQKKGVQLAPISEVLIRSEAANAPAPAAPAKGKSAEAAPTKGKAAEHEAAPAKAKAEPKAKTAH